MLKQVLRDLVYRTGFEKRLRWYLRKLNYIKKMRINNVEIRIPSIHGISCYESESWMIDLLAKVLLGQSGVFLDVGVNVGQTLVKLKALEPHREYVGFEPNPACIFYVQELIKANGFENCILLPVGLFTEECVLPLNLYYDTVTDGMSSLIDGFRPDNPIRSKFFVPVFRFDNLGKILGNKSFGIIKIDVEGSELEVVKSLLELIRRDKPIIMIEVLPVYSEDNTFRKNRQDELEQILADVKYKILRVEKTASGAYSGLRQVERIGIHSDLTQCDYAAIPVEKLEKLQVALFSTANKTLNPPGVPLRSMPAA